MTTIRELLESFILDNKQHLYSHNAEFLIKKVEENRIEFAKEWVKYALEEAYSKVYLSTYSGRNTGKSALGSGNNGNHSIVEINKDSITNFDYSQIK